MAEQVNKKINIYINGEQAGRSVRELKNEKKKLNRELEDMERNTEEYIRAAKKISNLNGALAKHRTQVRGIGQGMDQAKGSMGKFNKFGMKVASKAGAIGAIIGGVVAAGRSMSGWIKTNQDMQKSLSVLGSITGATTKDLKFYEKEAKKIGRTTTTSGVQTVEAFKLIGSAKPELLKNRDALVAVTNEAVKLAEAAQIDLPIAAKALTGALNQMGEGSGEANRFINALAAGSKEGAGDIEYLNASIEKSGAIADNANLSFEELVAGIETIAPKITEPTTAGLQFRNVILELSKGADEYNPKIVGMSKALENLSKDGYADTTKAAAKFGKINVVAATTLIQQRDRFDELTTAVTGTNTAYEQAQQNVENLDGAKKSLASAWELSLIHI